MCEGSEDGMRQAVFDYRANGEGAKGLNKVREILQRHRSEAIYLTGDDKNYADVFIQGYARAITLLNS